MNTGGLTVGLGPGPGILPQIPLLDNVLLKNLTNLLLVTLRELDLLINLLRAFKHLAL